jgi:hypothetical protein
VLIAQRTTGAQPARQIGDTEEAYYRWYKEFSGLKIGQAKRLKELERENARFRRRPADAEMDKAIRTEAAGGKC